MTPFLRAVLEADRPALFLDFDGTLAAIAMRPEGVRLAPARRRLLRGLSERMPVVIVSGRALDDLGPRIGIEGMTLAGNHGLEIRCEDKVWVHPAAVRSRSRLETALEKIAAGLPSVRGARLEDKGASAAIHFRASAAGSGPKIAHLVGEGLAGLEPWLEARPGKKILEIRPRTDWNKGAAVRRILSGLKPCTTPVYIGDDRTDEDAFLALAGKGPTARVGGRGPTAARFRLAGVDEVWAFLRALAGNRNSPA